MYGLDLDEVMADAVLEEPRQDFRQFCVRYQILNILLHYLQIGHALTADQVPKASILYFPGIQLISLSYYYCRCRFNESVLTVIFTARITWYAYLMLHTLTLSPEIVRYPLM